MKNVRRTLDAKKADEEMKVEKPTDEKKTKKEPRKKLGRPEGMLT